MRNNIITLTDSYKTSHWLLYPDKAERIYSYFESRTGARWHDTVFFGLQYILKEYLVGKVITKEGVAQAKELIDAHMGPGIFNEVAWIKMLEKYDGHLPVIIKAIPEGLAIPVSNVLFTIENTDEEFAWITNYLETILTHVWSASTVCTNSYEQKKILLQYLQATGDPNLIDFKLHDFSFRGCSSVETAGTGGAAHLVNFKGTDNIKGLEIVRDYYSGGVAGSSIVATEHSNMTLFGRDGEEDTMRRILQKFPSGLIACVSDQYDIYNAVANIWGDKLKEVVLARDGCLVIRPDSGRAEKILPDLLAILGEKFGQTRNDKGYFVLNPKVRLIQGDNVNIETLKLFLDAITKAGYSADNIAFGSGGALVQKVDRDIQRFATKCSAAKIDGKWRDVYKDPITDGGKKSKPGRLALIKTESGYETIKEDELGNRNNILETVFENGKLVKEYSFEEVRKNAEIK